MGEFKKRNVRLLGTLALDEQPQWWSDAPACRVCEPDRQQYGEPGPEDRSTPQHHQASAAESAATARRLQQIYARVDGDDRRQGSGEEESPFRNFQTIGAELWTEYGNRWSIYRIKNMLEVSDFLCNAFNLFLVYL